MVYAEMKLMSIVVEKVKILKSVLWTSLKQAYFSDLTTMASAMAYVTLLSIVPLLAVSLAIFQAFGGLEQFYPKIESFLVQILAQHQKQEVLKMIEKFIENIHTKEIGLFGLLGLIVTSMGLLSAVDSTLNRIWKIKVKRGLFQTISTYWFFISIGPLALSIFIGASNAMMVPSIEFFLPSGFFPWFLSVLFFCLLYHFVPQRKVKWQVSLMAAVLSASLWNMTKLLYLIYTKKVISYSMIYGSLGALPLFLIWIYISWIILLWGGIFSYEFQKVYDQISKKE